MQLTGIHHVTAVTADPRTNLRFYTKTLGLRLVKRTVNQDDVSAYHLFYADGAGSPGTDLTFFHWEMPRERRGNRSVTRTHLRVEGPESLAWWARRLREEGVEAGEITERDGRPALEFEDREGQRLALVDDGGAGDPPVPWEESPVPAPHQIRGLGPVVVTVPEPEPTGGFLREVLGMRKVREYVRPNASSGDDGPADDGRHAAAHVYAMGEGDGPHTELHLAVRPDLPPGRLGAGGVHHVAFRTPSRETYDAWAERLRELRVPNSGPVDRYYFRSLYLREPHGVLFEIATDGPGFAVDEDVEELGREVALPPFLEPRREEIVAALEPIES